MTRSNGWSWQLGADARWRQCQIQMKMSKHWKLWIVYHVRFIVWHDCGRLRDLRTAKRSKGERIGCAAMLSRFSLVRLCVTLWTVAHRAPLPWDSPGKNTGVGCHALLQGIFPTPDRTCVFLCLLHCRQILYPPSHLGSPQRILVHDNNKRSEDKLTLPES